MKLLLDEITPKRLRLDFSGHAVYSVEEAGLTGLSYAKIHAPSHAHMARLRRVAEKQGK